MRDLRNRLRAAVVFCGAGPVASFLPSFSPARARAGASLVASCTEGVATRRGTSRATLGSTRLEATTEQQEGHALLGDQEANANTIDNSKTDSSKGQGSSDTPKAAASATVELGDGSSGAGGEEEEVGPVPSVAAVTQEVDAAAGLGQTAEEAEVMAELLAQQPGGQEGEGDEAAPDTMRVRKRLKKYFPKDFQDTTWTVAVQWKHATYEVQTTKIALKADGSVVWLDKGKGSWILRTKSRDISIYRNYFLNWAGLRIYSAKLLDNTCDMYLSGVIKGWQPFLPLSRMGTWQAVRRGITVDENTPRPPWESQEMVEEVVFGDGRKKKNTPIEIPVDLD
ncbi:unnamed protein product [Pylaiella littoralis]